MNNSIFDSAISVTEILEIESISHYSQNRVKFWGRVVDYVGYVLGGIIVATPMIFGIVANVTGVI